LCNDVDMKRIVKMKECGSIQEIIEVFKKINRVREEMKHVNAVQSYEQKMSAIGTRIPQRDTRRQSYRNVTKNRNNQRSCVPVRQIYEPGRDQRNGHNRARVVCWWCQEEGYISWQCQKRVIKYFGFRVQGHIRREYQNAKYDKCIKWGHIEENCYIGGDMDKQGDRIKIIKMQDRMDTMEWIPVTKEWKMNDGQITIDM